MPQDSPQHADHVLDAMRDRPLQGIEAAVVEVCDKAKQFLDQMQAGQSIGIKPVPQLFPDWEVSIRLLPVTTKTLP